MKNEKEVVKQALEGDASALNQVVEAFQGLIYNLSIRFFWNPQDAEDASQEILVHVITNLAKFEGKSSLKTCIYRLATNCLLNAKRTQTEYLTFREGAEHLDQGLSYPSYEEADKSLLEEEVKLSCTTSMLICLSRPLRLAYLIGEILEFNSKEGGYILNISPSTFRKRLSNARKLIRGFMSNQCGIFDPKNPCRCSKQITYSLTVNWFQKDRLNFASESYLREQTKEVDRLIDEVAIFQSHPSYKVPPSMLEKVKKLISHKKQSFLDA